MPAAEAVAGPQGPGHQFQGVGQLAGELLQPRAPLVPQPQPRQRRTSPGRRAAPDTSGTPGQHSWPSPRAPPSTRPMPNSVLGLMWQSACSNSFCRRQELGRESSPGAIFLSPSKAVLRRMSALSSSSRRRLPTSMSSRVAALRRRVAEHEGQHARSGRPRPGTPSRRSSWESWVSPRKSRVESAGREPVSCDSISRLTPDRSPLIAQQHALLEQIRRQLDARRLQPVDERSAARPSPRTGRRPGRSGRCPAA